MFLSVKQQLSAGCCFVRAAAVFYLRIVLSVQKVSAPFQHTYVVLFAAFPFRSLLSSHFSEHLSFVLLCFHVLFSIFFFVFFVFFLGLACFVVFSYTVRWGLFDVP